MAYPMGLHPDEAQYWSWSRDLDWGYFSKPPVVAWLIAATTAICGDGVACVKASVPVLHGITALLIYGMARRLYDARTGFMAALIFITLPGVTFSSAIVSTDPPLMMFWALGMYALVRLGSDPDGAYRWWALLGVAVGLGFLSKYAMAFFVAALVVWLVLDRDGRRYFLAMPTFGRGVLLSGILGFVIYLPNFIWNMGTQFITYAHTRSNADLGGELFRPDKLLEFFGAQFGLFGPILFAALLWLMFRHRQWRAHPRARMLVAFILTMGLPILGLSLLTRANANWAAPVYVAASIFVTGELLARYKASLVQGSLILHIGLAVILMGGSLLASAPGIYAGYAVPAKLDPYRHHRGWAFIGDKINELRSKHPGAALLIRDRMAMAALLYHHGRSGKTLPNDYYAWYSNGHVTNHFRLTRPWIGPEKKGRNAVIISLWPDPKDILSRFSGIQKLGVIAGPTGTKTVRRIWVFYGQGFIGYKPHL
jgi:4-amino-4-deoxy-L-arabinose transferase-like glycosyltransferase